MNSNMLDHLKSLHTGAIDARNGYQEALKEADGKGMTPLFLDMIAMHARHADELARELTRDNEIPDERGSFMTMIHETIMDVRSLFNGLDESVLPGLIDGEKRNVAKYDDALKHANASPNVASLLNRQRENIVRSILAMETKKAASEHAS